MYQFKKKSSLSLFVRNISYLLKTNCYHVIYMFHAMAFIILLSWKGFVATKMINVRLTQLHFMEKMHVDR